MASYGSTWFKGYLSNLFQKVFIQYHSLCLLPVVRTASFHINDMQSPKLNGKLLLFADDAKCYFSIRSPDNVICFNLP